MILISGNFEEFLHQHDKVIVNFGAKWCKNCTILAPKLEALASQLLEFSVVVCKVDIDELPEVAEEYNISSLPCTIMLSNRKEYSRITGIDISSISDVMPNFLTSADSNLKLEVSLEPTFPELDEIDYQWSKPLSHLPIMPSKAYAAVLAGVLDGVCCDNLLPNHAATLIVEDAFGKGSVDVESLKVLLNPPTLYSGSLVRYNPDVGALSLFEYRVPTTNAAGTCSNLSALARLPFHLGTCAYHLNDSDVQSLHLSVDSLSGRVRTLADRLLSLNSIVLGLLHLTGADWIGVYRMMKACERGISFPALVKEAYVGEPSRAVFPVTSEFALSSTNSWVGLTGRGRSIPDTRNLSDDVSYYQCSGSVCSEICLPILRCVCDQWHVVGIVDLESWRPAHFTPQMIADVIRVCFDLGRQPQFNELPA